MRTRVLIAAAGAAVLVVTGVAAGLLGGFGVDEPSPDCQQAERALQPWAATMFEAHRTLPPDIAFPSEPTDEPELAMAADREARAANDIRAQADLVEDDALRGQLYQVADAFDVLSRSRLQPSHPGAPSSDFFRATTQMNDALYVVKQRCPDIGEEAPPSPVRR